jgi:glycosyltransferase involved in cell wall biosynthesis
VSAPGSEAARRGGALPQEAPKLAATSMSSGAPSVSVGMPVYNGAQFVARAIESVLNQDLSDLELVICDNASTDETQSICMDYARRDPRVRYFRNEKNLGAMANFSRVFELSRGNYFRWLSADDYVGPGALALCKAVLDQRPEVVLCCTKVDIVDGDGEVLRHYEELQQLEQPGALERMRAAKAQDPWSNAIYGLMRRDVLARTRLMGAFGGSDAALLVELSLHGRFAEVPERLFFRRLHREAYSYTSSIEQMRKFYAPQSPRKRALILYTWHHLVDHWRAIARAPLAPRERLALRIYLFRTALWSRKQLAIELVAYAHSFVRAR